MDEDIFVDNMLREYLIEYTKWLNDRYNRRVDIIEAVHGWMASDKANTEGFIEIISNPSEYNDPRKRSIPIDKVKIRGPK